MNITKPFLMLFLFSFRFFREQLFLFLFLFLFSGCSSYVGYLGHVSYGQINLLTNRISIEEALEKYTFSPENKKKLMLISELKTFAIDSLDLEIDETIYSSYVHLDRPYVTYILRVSSAYQLKTYEWEFPITGNTPYKGFFEKEKAYEEAKKFPKDKYDISIGGVRAYSTLGWFNDPVLSSMLSYSETEFVSTIFHELIHTILFFKDHINFNERIAEFIGRKLAIQFYQKKEGLSSPTVEKMKNEWEDEILFSTFMSQEYKKLDEWYKENMGKITKEMKQNRLKQIQDRFLNTIKPGLKTDSYNYFSSIRLNNAILLSYRTYNYNMAEFEKLFNSSPINQDIKAFIEYCSEFEDEDNPEKALSQKINQL